MDEKILQLEQADASLMEQVRSNNGSISAWFAASQNFATADEMTNIQKQVTRHESSIDLINVNFDSLKSRFENQALEVESLRNVSIIIKAIGQCRFQSLLKLKEVSLHVINLQKSHDFQTTIFTLFRFSQQITFRFSVFY